VPFNCGEGAHYLCYECNNRNDCCWCGKPIQISYGRKQLQTATTIAWQSISPEIYQKRRGNERYDKYGFNPSPSDNIQSDKRNGKPNCYKNLCAAARSTAKKALSSSNESEPPSKKRHGFRFGQTIKDHRAKNKESWLDTLYTSEETDQADGTTNRFQYKRVASISNLVANSIAILKKTGAFLAHDAGNKTANITPFGSALVSPVVCCVFNLKLKLKQKTYPNPNRNRNPHTVFVFGLSGPGFFLDWPWGSSKQGWPAVQKQSNTRISRFLPASWRN
jgi:hypothetical protein